MELETERLILRPWKVEDAPRLFELASVQEIGERAGWPPHKSVEESEEVIRTAFASDTVWAVVQKSDGLIIGCTGYMPASEVNIPCGVNERIAGYWIGKPYWNKGFCTESLQLVIRHAFEVCHLDALVSSHFIDNPASGRVLTKCGFHLIPGLFYDDNLHTGKAHPMRVLRLEKKDYEEQRKH